MITTVGGHWQASAWCGALSCVSGCMVLANNVAALGGAPFANCHGNGQCTLPQAPPPTGATSPKPAGQTCSKPWLLLQWPWQNQQNLSVQWLAQVHWVALRPCASPRHGRGVLPSLGHAPAAVGCMLEVPLGLVGWLSRGGWHPPILMPPKHMQSTMHQWAPMGLHAAQHAAPVANGPHFALHHVIACWCSHGVQWPMPQGLHVQLKI